MKSMCSDILTSLTKIHTAADTVKGNNNEKANEWQTRNDNTPSIDEKHVCDAYNIPYYLIIILLYEIGFWYLYNSEFSIVCH